MCTLQNAKFMITFLKIQNRNAGAKKKIEAYLKKCVTNFFSGSF